MNIYFSGIGGVGVGPLAMLAQDAGHNVSGSDLEMSPMIESLTLRGIKVSTDQSGKFINAVNQENPIDLFVYTAALPDNHPELKYAREYAITAVKRHELINQLIDYKNLKLIAVSGTHGKTTTTGIFVWVFKQLNIPLSYSIGTRLSFAPPARYDKKSEYFVYEADEFDKNFLRFNPYLSVVPSLDYDHPDTYKTKSEYKEAFDEFIAKSTFSVAWKDAGLSATTNVVNVNNDIILAGHNKKNATLVYEAMKQLFPKTKDKVLIDAINTFPGTERRFEKLATNIYTDYAHHPVEIASTIEIAKKNNQPIIVIYQPHQNIRQHQLINDGGYGNCFKGAKHVYWVPTYLSREDKKLKVLSPTELIKSTADPTFISVADMNDELEAKIKEHLNRNELIIAMSAGSLDKWIRRLADSS